MNREHLQQIFRHYIDRFEELNDSAHMEYYKWEIVDQFRSVMDDALCSPAESFSSKLYEAKKLSANLVDSYTQPFYGLVKFAEKEPETVRKMFIDLLNGHDISIQERQNRVNEFLLKSHSLKEKYYPDSFLYNDDVHSVTCYMFLYDPDRNYIYKAKHARKFADCIEFYDNWGSGDSVKLDVYYRMCDMLVDEIKKDSALIRTDESRFELSRFSNKPMYPDPEKHILLFDLIYCCYSYSLFDGIDFSRPNSKEKQLLLEKQEKAKSLFEDLQSKMAKQDEYEASKKYLSDIFSEGTVLIHKAFGRGKVKNSDGTRITVHFDTVGEKTLAIDKAAANNLIRPETMDADAFSAFINEHRQCLLNGTTYGKAITSAEKALEPYMEYLD